MRAKAIKGQSLEDIQSAFTEATADGFAPTLAVVFASVKQDLDVIPGFLDQRDVIIFGATSAGEFIDDELSEGSTAILLMDLNRSYFRVIFDEVSTVDTREVAARLAMNAQEVFTNPAFVVSGSGLMIDGEMIIRGIEDGLGTDSVIWGGMAGDDGIGERTHVFTNDRSSDQGVVMLILDQDRVTVFGRASSGWKGVGTAKTVTQSDGMWIQEIDERPALEQLTKYLGIDFGSDKSIIQIINDSAMNSFLLLREKGDPVIRSTLSINQDTGAIKVTANIETGEKIQVAMPPDFEVVNDVIRDFYNARMNGFADAEALIMFSCSGRFYHLGPLLKKEIHALVDVYQASMAGFFTYGEFGRAINSNNEIHNFTCCWVGSKEQEADQP